MTPYISNALVYFLRIMWLENSTGFVYTDTKADDRHKPLLII